MIENNLVMEKQTAILMADLSGYSALTDVHGAAKAAYIIHKYLEIVNNSLKGSSHLHESVGDQVVIVSPDADDLFKTAIALQENTRRVYRFLPVHAGIHIGKLLEQNGHYYGSAINLTARIAAKAKGGKILCSVDFIHAVTGNENLGYKSYGYVRFKNIMEKIEVVELIQQSNQLQLMKYVDPVCYMQLDREDVQHSANHRGADFYFCSNDCLNISPFRFSTGPKAYRFFFSIVSKST